jgi:hypothetical protein
MSMQGPVLSMQGPVQVASSTVLPLKVPCAHQYGHRAAVADLRAVVAVPLHVDAGARILAAPAGWAKAGQGWAEASRDDVPAVGERSEGQGRMRGGKRRRRDGGAGAKGGRAEAAVSEGARAGRPW